MRYLILVFIAIAQLGSVAWMIGGREWVLAKGREVRFVTEPFDPYDPFRGRYVALDFEAAHFEVPEEYKLAYGMPVYAILSVDEEGYASVQSLQQDAPADDSRPYIYVKKWRSYQSYHDSRVHSLDADANEVKKIPYKYNLTLPFQRYYMNEDAAPEVERRYREANRRDSGDGEDATNRENYLTVRILKGRAVAEQLYIEGKPVD